MSAATPTSFWGNLNIDDQSSPAHVMREQARALTRDTKGLLVGEVVPGEPIVSKDGKPTGLRMNLIVRVPALNDYRLGICRVDYPLSMKVIVLHDLINGKDKGHKDIAAFESTLRACLGSDEVRRILSSLMATAKATVE